MSFDLYFCNRLGAQIDVGQVQRHMKRLEHMTESQSNDGSLIQFEYRDPTTDVYRLFDLSKKAPTGQEETPVLPDGYVTMGLSVSINFVRPHFFALEVMPIVSGIADALGLSLYDPQAEQMYGPRTEPGGLIQSWVKSNESVTRGLSRDQGPTRKPWLGPEKSLYWWRYTRARAGLQSSLTEDVFVPSILLMADAEHQVKLVVVWSAEVQRRLWLKRTSPLPQLFPECDFLMLAWHEHGSTRLGAIVPHSAAITALAALLEDMPGPVAGLKLLRPERRSAAGGIFEALPRLDPASLRRISSDDFVDVVDGP